MQKIIDFITKHRDVAFATVNGGKPDLRVLQVMLIRNNEFYFATNAAKEIFKQVQTNPEVMIMATHGSVFVRVAGTCSFDIDDATKCEIYEKNKILQMLYQNYLDIAYIRMTASTGTYYDLAGRPPVNETYEF